MSSLPLSELIGTASWHLLRGLLNNEHEALVYRNLKSALCKLNTQGSFSSVGCTLDTVTTHEHRALWIPTEGFSNLYGEDKVGL